ncbi:hypothetical protein ACFWBS_54375 [Streptomyces mirabilis]|uniref:hypothetical protein n=1 Tax=Streptomyces mirabilis TaxID=68239 RepID=UPI003666C93B
MRIVIPRCQPIRSAITDTGIVGVSRKSSRVYTSTASTAEPFSGRSYFGGRSCASPRFTVFFEVPRCRAIALIGICSAWCSLVQPADLCPVFHVDHLFPPDLDHQGQDQMKITKWVGFDTPSVSPSFWAVAETWQPAPPAAAW